MTAADPTAVAARLIPERGPFGAVERLAGGNLNWVWRVSCRTGSIVVKAAPPFVATQPSIPLSPERVRFEARALRLFSPGQPLASLATAWLRPPLLLAEDAESDALILEDVGAGSGLGMASLRGAGASWGERLGRFIGQLHRETAGSDDLAGTFANVDVQRTRLQIQYRAVASMVASIGVGDASRLGAVAEALGEALCGPGCCLTMGDLWPPSCLLTTAGLRLVDWEFAHFGHPLQDVAHLWAHLWMMSWTGASEHRADIEALTRGFGGTYGEEVRGRGLWKRGDAERAVTHAAAEVLVRSVGPFSQGYAFAGRPEAAVAAAHEAAEWLRRPARCELIAAVEAWGS